MQVFWKLSAFFAKVYAGTGALLWVCYKIQPATTWLSIIVRAVLAFAISLGIFFADEVYLYPRFRNPLRKLPTVNSGYDLRLVLEGPRGKTPLRWMKEMPDVDVIHSRGKYGQSVLYPVSPEALRDVLSRNVYDWEKPYGLRAYLSKIFGFNGLIVIEAHSHQSQRRSLVPAFNIKHIRALYPIMYNTARELVDRMEGDMYKLGSVDVPSWSSKYALDVIGHGALSQNFNALSMDTYHPIAQSFARLMDPKPYLILFLAACLALPPTLLFKLPVKAARVIAGEQGAILKQANQIYEDKKRQQQEKKTHLENNILSRIINSTDLQRHEIIDQIRTIIGAGHETSSVSITWSLHLLTLCENWHYQDLIRNEIRSALTTAPGSEAEAQTVLQQALERMPYLNGLVEEVLRLFPSVPATMREAVRETSINGTRVPKGTMLVIMMYSINRNPRYWGTDADEFRPERWVDTLPDGTLRSNKHGGAASNYCVETFLHGPRACVGKDFAKAELKFALIALLGRYEIRRLPGDEGKVKVKGAVSVKPQEGLKVQMRRIDGWAGL